MFIAKMTHHDGNHWDRAQAVYGTGKDQRFAIPGFWPNARVPWKTGFSHQVMS